MKRRTLLKRGLVGGGLLLLAGTGLFAWPTRRRFAPAAALRVFDAREFQVMAAVAARVVTQPGADPAAIATMVDLEVSRLCPELQRDTKRLLLLFENALAGVLLDARMGPFTALSPNDQDAVLASWRASRITLRRAGYHSLRKLALGAYYRDPATWALSAYPGPPSLGVQP